MPYLFVTLGWTLAVATFAGTLTAAYLASAVAFAEARTSTRLAATLAVWLLVASGWFLLTSGLGGLSFASTVAAGASATLAVIALTRGRAEARRARERDWTRLAQVSQAVRRWPFAWAFLPLASTMAVRTARDLISPPMATDALTYHLFRAGRWVQTGDRSIEHAPDAWSYVAYYPPTGDGLHALTLLPASTGLGDALLAPFNAFFWIALGLAAYAAARTWELDGRRAALVAGVVSSIPAVVAFAGAGYVDHLVLIAFLLAVALMSRGPRGLVVGLGCLGLTASIKATGLPIAALGGLFALRFAIEGDRRHKTAFAIGVALALAITVPAYLAGWIDHQNPLYPFALDVAGLHRPGNIENEAVHRGAFAPPKLTTFRWGAFGRALFWPKLQAGAQHLNFGPLMPVILGLGAFAGLRSLVLGGRRYEAAWLLALTVVFALRLGGADSLAHRTFLAPAVGRLLLVPVASLVLLAGTLATDPDTKIPRRAVDGYLVVTLVGGAAIGFPRGLGAPEALPAFALAGLAMAAAFGGWVAVLRGPSVGTGPRRRAGWFGVIAILVAVAGGPALHLVRTQMRYRVWAAAVSADAFDPHPTDARVMRAWPLWRALDEPSPHRVAFTAGWDGMGHNWYRYPLLGSRLQNEVLYVPITADGSIVDYRDPNAALARGKMTAWLDRLAAARIDRLVVGSPPRCPELLWAQAHPEVFELVAREGDNFMFVVHPRRIGSVR